MPDSHIQRFLWDIPPKDHTLRGCLFRFPHWWLQDMWHFTRLQFIHLPIGMNPGPSIGFYESPPGDSWWWLSSWQIYRAWGLSLPLQGYYCTWPGPTSRKWPLWQSCPQVRRCVKWKIRENNWLRWGLHSWARGDGLGQWCWIAPIWERRWWVSTSRGRRPRSQASGQGVQIWASLWPITWSWRSWANRSCTAFWRSWGSWRCWSDRWRRGSCCRWRTGSRGGWSNVRWYWRRACVENWGGFIWVGTKLCTRDRRTIHWTASTWSWAMVALWLGHRKLKSEDFVFQLTSKKYAQTR